MASSQPIMMQNHDYSTPYQLIYHIPTIYFLFHSDSAVGLCSSNSRYPTRDAVALYIK